MVTRNATARSIAAAALVFVVSSVLLVLVLRTSVDAYSEDSNTVAECGSMVMVLVQGSANYGGEELADPKAFDARCVDNAEDRLPWAVGALAMVVISGVVTARLIRRGHLAARAARVGA